MSRTTRSRWEALSLLLITGLAAFLRLCRIDTLGLAMYTYPAAWFLPPLVLVGFLSQTWGRYREKLLDLALIGAP